MILLAIEQKVQLTTAITSAMVSRLPFGYTNMAIAPQQSDYVEALTGNLSLLEPGEWIGNRLPLLSVLGGADTLLSGLWTILKHHRGCPECERAQPSPEEQTNYGDVILLVETPPDNNPGGSGLGNRYTRLFEDREWSVQTPVMIRMLDGIVMSVAEEFFGQKEAHP